MRVYVCFVKQGINYRVRRKHGLKLTTNGKMILQTRLQETCFETCLLSTCFGPGVNSAHDFSHFNDFSTYIPYFY